MPYADIQDSQTTIDSVNPNHFFALFSAPNLDVNERPVLTFQVNPDLDAAGQAELEMTLNGIQILDVSFNSTVSPARAWQEIVGSNILTSVNNQLVATAVTGGFTISDVVMQYKRP